MDYDAWALEAGIDATTKAHTAGWESLTEIERIFCVVNDIEREVYNGGFDQFFYNSSGDFSMYAVEYLVKLGAMDTAKIVQKALSFFPNSKPEADQEKRWEQLRKIETKAASSWEELDNKFYDLEENRNLKMWQIHITSTSNGTKTVG